MNTYLSQSCDQSQCLCHSAPEVANVFKSLRQQNNQSRQASLVELCLYVSLTAEQPVETGIFSRTTSLNVSSSCMTFLPKQSRQESSVEVHFYCECFGHMSTVLGWCTGQNQFPCGIIMQPRRLVPPGHLRHRCSHVPPSLLHLKQFRTGLRHFLLDVSDFS